MSANKSKVSTVEDNFESMSESESDSDEDTGSEYVPDREGEDCWDFISHSGVY